MALDPIFPGGRIEKMTAAGLWGDELIVDHLDRVAAAMPDKVAVVDNRAAAGETRTLSFRQVKRLSERVALGLTELGIGRGDVVAAQLPNWWHYFALYPACARIGAAFNPLMPIFRERELRFMLGFAKTRLLVVPQVFRDVDYPAMIDRLRPELPDLQHVLIAGGEAPGTSFEHVLLDRRFEDVDDLEGRLAALRPGANEVTELMYTSGTTGEPKGVMHTPNTLLCKARMAAELFDLGDGDAIYMGSPLAHQTGFMYGCLLSLVKGVKCVLQDIWEPVRAARMIQDEGCTITFASTPFLSDLVLTADVSRYDLSRLRIFLCAGAPIPRVLLRNAAEAFPNLQVLSGWGMTENGLVTATYPGDAEAKIFETDGRALPHQEVRVVGEDSRLLPPDQEGRLQARGPTTFVGYFRRPDARELDDDLWLDTGDIARMDADGYIRITGRAKDIIIRGGENVPVVEVEGLLYRHDAVQDVAVVGYPDERLGERACALVQLRPGEQLTFDDMVAFLKGCGLATNYLPERLKIIAEFPRTPSGKIQKFKLRQMLASGDGR